MGSTGNVVGVGRVRGKVGAQFGDQILIVLVPAVGFDIKVPAVDVNRPEWTRNAASRGVSVRVPEILTDGFGFGLGSERVGTNGTSKRENNLDTIGLAGRNLTSEGATVGTFAAGADRAVLSNNTGRDRNAISVLVKEGKDDNVDTGVGCTIGRQVVIFTGCGCVLSPVNNNFTTGAASLQSVRSSDDGAGHKAEADQSG